MAKRIAKRILLIGWDAADWQHINPLLDSGQLPGLESLINRGVMGNLATLQPVLSPMLWNSIATGMTADKHGVLGFTQPLPSGKGIQPFSSRSRKVKAIWNICHQQGMRSNVVGWWASHPAEPINGNVVSNLFNGLKKEASGRLKINPGTFHPEHRAAELAELKVHPDEITAADILPFIPDAAEIDQSKDSRLTTFCKLLSDCASIHSVATQLIEECEYDLTAVYFDAIDHFSHAFMYYHPPKMANVSQQDFDLYKNVISGVYRFHDMVLQRLVQLAGDETTVILCSDHGFQSGNLRPYSTPAEPAGPAAWHRDLGIIVMAGPGIKSDDRIYGANIIDITPTILYQLGLPVGEDMDGRVLLDAFENPSTVDFIESWESVPGDFGMVDPQEDQVINDDQSQDLVNQFVALGYIEDPGDDLEKAAVNCQLELDYNLSRVYLSTGRSKQAIRILTELVKKMPWEDRYWKNLAHAFFEEGYFKQAEKIVTGLYVKIEKTPVQASVFLAKCNLELSEFDSFDRNLSAAMNANPRQPTIYIMAGRMLTRINEYSRAEEAFRKALKLDPDSAQGWLGLAEIYLKRNENQAAAEAALNALVILYRLERAHWILGVAMKRMGEIERAKEAFEVLLSFGESDLISASHRQLSLIFSQQDEKRLADRHRQQARDCFPARQKRKKEIRSRREQLFDLPNIPSMSERFESHRLERPRPQGGRQTKVTPGSSGRSLTIVSGLPRSGTSLMMQMLSAGGLPAKTDHERTPDEDNPEGYLEWEAIKRLHKEPRLFDDPSLDGCAIKVVSMLLTSLPKQHRYQVIFMRRPIREIVRSQQKMIERKGHQRDATIDLDQKLERHRIEALDWLGSRKFIDLLVIDYPELIAHPMKHAVQVADFLGDSKIQSVDAMVSVVKPDLHRHRERDLQRG